MTTMLSNIAKTIESKTIKSASFFGHYEISKPEAKTTVLANFEVTKFLE